MTLFLTFFHQLIFLLLLILLHSCEEVCITSKKAVPCIEPAIIHFSTSSWLIITIVEEFVVLDLDIMVVEFMLSLLLLMMFMFLCFYEWHVFEAHVSILDEVDQKQDSSKDSTYSYKK